MIPLVVILVCLILWPVAQDQDWKKIVLLLVILAAVLVLGMQAPP